MINFKALYVLPILFLSSCSFISFSDAIPLFRAAIFDPPKVIITKEEFDSRAYSFIVAQFEDGPGAIMTLSNIDENGVLEWVSAENQLIYTRNGKIILTDGLLHDFQYLDWNGENWENKAIYPSKRLVKLKNPDAIVEHLIDIEYLEAEDLELQFKSINSAQKIREKIVINRLKWEAENYYWLNDQALVIKTIQTLNPKLPAITVEFFYVFNS